VGLYASVVSQIHFSFTNLTFFSSFQMLLVLLVLLSSCLAADFTPFPSTDATPVKRPISSKDISNMLAKKYKKLRPRLSAVSAETPFPLPAKVQPVKPIGKSDIDGMLAKYRKQLDQHRREESVREYSERQKFLQKTKQQHSLEKMRADCKRVADLCANTTSDEHQALAVESLKKYLSAGKFDFNKFLSAHGDVEALKRANNVPWEHPHRDGFVEMEDINKEVENRYLKDMAKAQSEDERKRFALDWGTDALHGVLSKAATTAMTKLWEQSGWIVNSFYFTLGKLSLAVNNLESCSDYKDCEKKQGKLFSF
jgi:hypothetical protein